MKLVVKLLRSRQLNGMEDHRVQSLKAGRTIVVVFILHLVVPFLGHGVAVGCLAMRCARTVVKDHI